MLDSFTEWEQAASSNRREIRLDRQAMIEDGLIDACGYRDWASVLSIAADHGCRLFRGVSRWGEDCYNHNELYTIDDHIAMLRDGSRVKAYELALTRVSEGRVALDIGTGPFCLLSRLAIQAGALSVDCVEQAPWAVRHAIEVFEDEADIVECQELRELRHVGASLTRSRIKVKSHQGRRGGHRMTLTMKKERRGRWHYRDRRDSRSRSRTRSLERRKRWGLREVRSSGRSLERREKWSLEPRRGETRLQRSRSRSPQQIRLFEGFSSDVHLPEGYNLIVHEILGHIASSEGVVQVLLDLRARGLLTRDCVFVPRRAVTLFAPTEQIDLTCLERILHAHVNGMTTSIKCLTKYHATRFPAGAALAPSSLLEDLDFGGELEPRQARTAEFRTRRGGVFDGLHFHMIVNMDDYLTIDTLLQETTWRTTYVKLFEPGIYLPSGSRIVCETEVRLDSPEPHYSISVAIGEYGEEHKVASFTWSGSS